MSDEAVVTMGKFMGGVWRGTGVPETREWLRQVRTGYGFNWQHLVAVDLAPQHVIALGYAISRHIADQLKKGPSNGLAEKAHTFLLEICTEANDLGVCVKLDQVDQIDSLCAG